MKVGLQLMPPMATSGGSRSTESMQPFFASGLGGQLIYVIPALDLIVTTTASFEDTPHDPDQWKKIQMLIPRFVLPAIFESEHLS